MSQQGRIHRLSLIIECLKGITRHTFQQLLDKLHESGHEIDKRSLNRDIKILREEYGLEIICEKPDNYYKLHLTHFAAKATKLFVVQ